MEVSPHISLLLHTIEAEEEEEAFYEYQYNQNGIFSLLLF